MAELAKSITTAGFTAMFGVAVLVISQMIQKLFVEPIQEQRKALGEAEFLRATLANMNNMHDLLATQATMGLKFSFFMEPEEASKALRTAAGRIRSATVVIPAYDLLARMGLVMKQDDAFELARMLTAWSKSMSGGETTGFQNRISELLGKPHTFPGQTVFRS